MLAKTITYNDYDNNERTETLYFNMNKMELTEFAADLPDDVFKNVSGVKTIQDVVNVANKMGSKGIIKFIKELVLRSYGVKSEDGRRFIKSKELSEEFSQTIAYDMFMSELMSDDNAASNFVNGLIPASMAGELDEVKAQLESSNQES